MSRNRAARLNGAVVVITGASSGNGRAIAHDFARQGARLVLAARRETALAEVAAECRALGGEAVVVMTDVGDADSVARLADEAVRTFGGFDVWVNNAGVLQFGRLDETPPEIVEQVIRTNLIGYLNGSREALRRFRAAGEGVLINVNSILGALGHPYTSAYVASKFAGRGLTESLRGEVADQPGIRVCEVLPAAIDTPIYQRAANYTGRAVRPLRVLHPPETVGRAVVRLAKRPRRQAYAGWSARPAVAGRALAPALAEKVVRAAADSIELERRAAAPSAGNLFAPSYDAYRLSGGWRMTRRARTGVGATLGLTAAAAVLGLLVACYGSATPTRRL